MNKNFYKRANNELIKAREISKIHFYFGCVIWPFLLLLLFYYSLLSLFLDFKQKISRLPEGVTCCVCYNF